MEVNDPVSEVKKLVQQGAINAAENILDNLRTTCDTSPCYLHALAQFQYFLGDFQAAVETCQTLGKRWPGYADHRYILYYACSHLGHLDVLGEQFERLSSSWSKWDFRLLYMEMLEICGLDEGAAAYVDGFRDRLDEPEIAGNVKYNLLRHAGSSIMRARGIAAGIGEYAAAFTMRPAVSAIYGINDPGYWCGDTPLPQVLRYVRAGGFGDWIQFQRYRAVLAYAGVNLVCHDPWPCADVDENWLQSYSGTASHRLLAALAGDAPFQEMWATPFSLFTALFPLTGYLPNYHSMYLPKAAGELAEFAESIRNRADGRPCVAIFWSANESAHMDFAAKSLQLHQIRPLLERSDIHWIVFQRGLEMSRWLLDDLSKTTTNLDESIDLLGLAELLVAAADMVISIDSGPLHLAASLNLPTILLASHHADWRYERLPAATPWYPSVRILRQRRPGEWNATVLSASRALDDWIRTGVLA